MAETLAKNIEAHEQVASSRDSQPSPPPPPPGNSLDVHDVSEANVNDDVEQEVRQANENGLHVPNRERKANSPILDVDNMNLNNAAHFSSFGEEPISFSGDYFSTQSNQGSHGVRLHGGHNSGLNNVSLSASPQQQKIPQYHQQQQSMPQPQHNRNPESAFVSQVAGQLAQEMNITSEHEFQILHNCAARMNHFYQQRITDLSRQASMHPVQMFPPHLQPNGQNLQSMSMMQQQQAGQAALNMGLGGPRRDIHGMGLNINGAHDRNRLAPNLPQVSGNSQPNFQTMKAEPGGKRKLLDDASDTLSNISSSVTSKRTKSSRSSRWTKAQDEALKNAVDKFDGRNWKAIAEHVPDRDHVQCLQRWKKVLRPGLVKGHWSQEEDALLLQLIQDEKMHSWAMVASKIKGRTAKQCRERWSLNLDPGINRTPWSQEEDALLLQLHDKMGGKWSEIKSEFQGRTENAVKTRYKSLVRAKAREWTQDQDRKLIELRMKHGKNWASIKKEMPGRSRNAIKVRCKTLEYDNNINA